MKTFITLVLVLLAQVAAWSQIASSPIPDFTATALTGEKVSAAQLIGQPTILIVQAKEKIPARYQDQARTRPGS